MNDTAKQEIHCFHICVKCKYLLENAALMYKSQ